MHNRVFFSQRLLGQWVSSGKAEVVQGELSTKASDRKFRLVEAMLVVGEVGGTGDPYGILGKVKTVNFLAELGAELLGTSMLIGESAYDVVPGFLGMLVGSSREHPRVQAPQASQVVPTTPEGDEELLTRHLLD
jgi:hypothetical protein